MRPLNLVLASALLLCLTLLPACGGRPPADANKATVIDVQDIPAQTPASEAPAGEPGDASPSPQPAPAENAKTYKITANDNSMILFKGYKTVGAREGGFGNFNGTVALPNGEIEGAQVSVTIDTTSLFSDANALTEILIGEEFFNIAKFPEAKFITSKIEKNGDQYTVTGNLTMRDVTQGIQFPAKIQETPKGLKVDAEFTINRTQWGITSHGLKDTIILDDVLLTLDILADPA